MAIEDFDPRLHAFSLDLHQLKGQYARNLRLLTNRLEPSIATATDSSLEGFHDRGFALLTDIL